MIEVLTNLTVSAVMVLSSSFSDGVKSMEKKEYAAAREAFTKVIEAEDGGAAFAAPSLLLRAQCSLESKLQKEAMRDIEKLFSTEGSERFWKAAVEVYEKAGGKPEKLLPKKGPAQVWEAFMAAMRAGDLRKAAGSVDSAFADVIKGAMESDEFQEITEWLGKNEFRGGSESNVLAVSSKMFCVGGDEPGLTVFFVREANEWKVSGMYPRFQDMGQQDRADAVPGEEEAEDPNIRRISALTDAISSYVWETSVMPQKLEDLLKEWLEDKSALNWEHPETGEKVPSIYMMDVVSDPAVLAREYLTVEGVLEGGGEEQVISIDGGVVSQVVSGQARQSPIIIAAPVSMNGRRAVGTGESTLEMDETAFARMAVAGGWKIKDIEKVLKADEAAEKTVAECVENMRRGSSAERKQARDKLISMGTGGLLEIKKYENDADPEIRESIKMILNKIK